jgi:hypothetical protein
MMTAAQEKAARSLKAALKKVRDAGLKLRVFEGAVYVFPLGFDEGAYGRVSEHADHWEKGGIECKPEGLDVDGGTGW